MEENIDFPSWIRVAYDNEGDLFIVDEDTYESIKRNAVAFRPTSVYYLVDINENLTEAN